MAADVSILQMDVSHLLLKLLALSWAKLVPQMLHIHVCFGLMDVQSGTPRSAWACSRSVSLSRAGALAHAGRRAHRAPRGFKIEFLSR